MTRSILNSIARFSVAWSLLTTPLAHANDSQTIAASYNLTIPPGFSSIANHLDHGANTVAKLLPSVPEGTLLYKFDNIREIHTVNQFQSGEWLRPEETLAPGEGALIRNPGKEFSLTFTGTRPSNAQFPRLNRFNLISLPVPGETTVPPPTAGDSIFRFDASQQSFNAHTFDDLDNDWVPRLNLPPLGPVTRIGESFFYLNRARPPIPQPPVSDPVSWGTVYFCTRLRDAGIPGVSERSSNLGEVWRAVDAQIKWGDETGVGEGFTAQLYGGPAGTPIGNLVPLTPATTFQTMSAALRGYVNPVLTSVPGVWAGGSATLVLRVFDGASFDSSIVRGESAPISVKLGGGTLFPGNLVGLQGFSLPEPAGGGGRIRVELTADGLRLSYTGTLQSASTVAGPYTDVVGATSPASISFSGAAKFYRLKQ